jgi:ferrochelatase
MQKVAVILFNLGGPDNIKSVKPFLFNLFNDKAIIALPNPFRFLLAKLISSKREQKAIGIYNQIGGKSPIVEETFAQATALEKLLPKGYRVFFAMRYWHPFSKEVAKKVAEFKPEKIIFLPLYPQYSTTTTGSSFTDFQLALKKEGLQNIPVKKICCYPTNDGLVENIAELIGKQIKGLKNFRILFSAHGLPEKIIKNGDPYQFQVELTVKKVVERLGIKGLDFVICYQSRVGPLKWIEPYTEDEIKRAGADKKAIVLVPIAFVSEHSETLVELDIEYKHLATQNGVKKYIRIPTVRAGEEFIKGLAGLVLSDEQRAVVCMRENGSCFAKCPNKDL